MADVDGRFSIPSIKPGNYSLSLTMTGMDTVTRTLAVPATDTILNVKDITLTETSITLKEAVVTAVPDKTLSNSTPVPTPQNRMPQ